jgi:hypothetical protein
MNWQPFNDDCPHCGCEAEVYTTAAAGFAIDGDEARCTGCGCPGMVSCDEDGTGYVLWSEDPDIDWVSVH